MLEEIKDLNEFWLKIYSISFFTRNLQFPPKRYAFCLKRKGSYSKHPFSGANLLLVSGRGKKIMSLCCILPRHRKSSRFFQGNFLLPKIPPSSSDGHLPTAESATAANIFQAALTNAQSVGQQRWVLKSWEEIGRCDVINSLNNIYIYIHVQYIYIYTCTVYIYT